MSEREYIIDGIKVLFERGNHKLAYGLAIGQNVDLLELDIDFNRMTPNHIDENYGMAKQWIINTELDNIYLSVCAGKYLKCKCTEAGIYYLYEVAVITSGRILNFEEMPCLQKLTSAEQTTQSYYPEQQIVFNYLTVPEIMEIIKHINNDKKTSN